MSYIVNINIHTGNASFGESASEEADEVARILRELADKIQLQSQLESFGGKRLLDDNGNKVGTIRVDPL